MSSVLNRNFTAALGAALLAVLPAAGYGHGGEDHGEDKAAAPVPQIASGPRLESTTPDFALLAAAEKNRLVVWLDRYATNEPVLDAKIQAESAGRKLEFKPAAGGTYEAGADWLTQPGRHEISFTIEAKDTTDLMIGVLEISSPAAPAKNIVRLPGTRWIWAGIGGVLLVAGTVLAVLRGRRKIKEAL
ncbi:MAG: hypothetical protein HYU77_15550 [Betaproteobacteria bacterium]|nr:hypothetical protein [Betaproteobacteria bacterium]